MENSNAIENIIHPTLYFVITEHFSGEHFYKETEKHKSYSFRYFKVDCGARDSISLKDLVKLQFKIPPLDTSELVKVKGMTRHLFRFEYDAGLLVNQMCKLNVFSGEIRIRMSLHAEANTPSIIVLYFRPKVSIVVHRKRAIYMFSKYSTRSKTNSGFCIQSMLLISYALVPRKRHRKQLIYLKRMDHCRRI